MHSAHKAIFLCFFLQVFYMFPPSICPILLCCCFGLFAPILPNCAKASPKQVNMLEKWRTVRARRRCSPYVSILTQLGATTTLTMAPGNRPAGSA